MTAYFMSFLAQYGIIGLLWLRGSLFMYFQVLVVGKKKTSDETDEWDVTENNELLFRYSDSQRTGCTLCTQIYMRLIN